MKPAKSTKINNAKTTSRMLESVPVPQSIGNEHRVVELAESEITGIDSGNFEIMTSPDGPIAVTLAQSKLAVLLKQADKLILLVAKSQVAHHDVSTVRALLRRQNYNWTQEYLVGLEVIRSVYSKSGFDINEITVESNKKVAMEQAFIELIATAVKQHASDIHIKVEKYETKISFRVDGELAIFKEITASEGSTLSQAAFAMADTSDPTYISNEQQSARINGQTLSAMQFNGNVESLRLQFNPIAGGGRYLVIRILYQQKPSHQQDLISCGYASIQIEQITSMRLRTTGINIISGPTGSGKSTTLQRLISAQMRERPDISTITIEDPPEYIIEGAAQIPVTNAKTIDERSEKFSIAIAGALRSDPNNIMIGEVRDSSSAKLAFEAAMTGHSVWTTLHANSAISIIDRLLDLQVEPYKLSDISNISGLISQRLVKRIDPNHSITIDEAVKQNLIDKSLVAQLCKFGEEIFKRIRFNASSKFNQSITDHYSGRIIVAETILPNQDFLNLLQSGSKAEAETYWIQNLDGVTMFEAGFLHVVNGSVDPREIQHHFGSLGSLDVSRMQELCMKYILGFSSS